MDNDAIFWMGAGAVALAFVIVALVELIIAVRAFVEAWRRWRGRRHDIL